MESRDIWNLYEDFEKPVHEEDANVINYDTTCHVALGLGSTNYKKYKDFCMKLMRNLGAYSSGQELCRPKTERCKTLNNWLYYVIIDQKVPTDIISTIFNKSKEIIGEKCNIYMCDFSYDKKIKEPKKIIKLLYLQDNIEIFLKKMKNKGDEHYCNCEKYIYECVDIYKTMNTSYCSNEDDKLNKHKNTCETLKTFQYSYMTFLFNKEDMSNKIPSLIDDNIKNLVKCKSSEQIQELQAVEGSQPDGYIQDYLEEEEK
ncbi:hypothetical protein PVIIG_06223 [Plasmodium vivax India VII]|uniref:Uncharacterized protein n=1 Tax=Plasmodium vivax India VII TaxID=1077284 RepID=A0A0J9S2R7_PLAVI|nr:hypothetical protein PVIIG_06223 [Plasmodium vivax India VII]